VSDDVFSSPDGRTWNTKNRMPFKRYGHTTVEFPGQDSFLWVLGGHDGTNAFNSVIQFNGDSWNAPQGSEFPPRYLHTSVVFDEGGKGDQMWVIGGIDASKSEALDDVWHSPTGTSWQGGVPAKPFPKRGGHASVVFKLGVDRMLVIGGFDPSGGTTVVYKDVWSSLDGSDWQLMTDTLPFGGRYGHSLVDDGAGKLWLFGGTDGSRVYNDLWTSDDAVNWSLVSDYVTDVDRHGHSHTMFLGRQWGIGGFSKLVTDNPLSDVWFSP